MHQQLSVGYSTTQQQQLLYPGSVRRDAESSGYQQASTAATGYQQVNTAASSYQQANTAASDEDSMRENEVSSSCVTSGVGVYGQLPCASNDDVTVTRYSNFTMLLLIWDICYSFMSISIFILKEGGRNDCKNISQMKLLYSLYLSLTAFTQFM